MPATFVIYPPGAGGNHLKNMLCLPGVFSNSGDLDIGVYKDKPDRAAGEVWCVGGRNLQDIFFDRLDLDPLLHLILPAHFGEMWQYRDRILTVQQKRAILIKIDHAVARRRLEQRQMRLGQQIHPYWLDEELIWCYQPSMYHSFFDIPEQNCLEVCMLEFWQRDMVDLELINRLESFLELRIPRDQARDIHLKWIQKNDAPNICI